MMAPERIERLAKKHGWTKICHQENICLISFGKVTPPRGPGDFMRVNVYYSKMTVVTALKHPQQGRTTLCRRWVDADTMEKIFMNPRVHTPLGYGVSS